ncbi:MAG TPA: hypothetical protein VIL74_25850 [Pyrinomonadaceae bacterium]|jgi:hypothetical protein
MSLRKSLFAPVLVALCAAVCFAQTKPAKPNAPAVGAAVKSSPAYAEVLLRKTELLSEVESLLIDYTEEFRKVKEMRFEAGLLQKELDRLSAAGDASKLSAALGRLMVRKCEVAAELWTLQQQFNDQHPDVKRARRKAEIFEAAVNEILQGK